MVVALGQVQEALGFHENLICVLKMNKGLNGFGTTSGRVVINDRSNFWVNYPFKRNYFFPSAIQECSSLHMDNLSFVQPTKLL